MKFNCEKCEDKGYILKTEWTVDRDGRDMDYDRMIKCECQDDE